MKSYVQLREDINGVYVENLTEIEVGCVSDIIKLLMHVSKFMRLWISFLANILQQTAKEFELIRLS